MLYREILKKSLEISWKNKYLWFFGLFAAILANGGSYEIVSKILWSNSGTDFIFSLKNFFSQTGILSKSFFANVAHLAATQPLSLMIVFVIYAAFIFIAALLLYVIIVSQAAIVNNSSCLLTGKKNDLAGGIEAGIKNFWPVLGYNVLLKIFVYLAFTVISLPILLSADRISPVINLVYLILFLVLVPAIIAASLIFKFAIAYTVLKGKKFGESLRMSWELFRGNWIASLEMGFILLLISILATFATIFILLIAATPFMFLFTLFYVLGSLAGILLIIIVSFVLFLFLIALAGALLSVFQITAWTNFFIKLSGKGAVSKIVRVGSNFIK